MDIHRTMTISIEPTNQSVPATATLPTAFGTFNLHAFVDPKDGAEHALLTVGDLTSAEAPLVRIHSECLTGDAFGSLKCDCGPQLQLAMRAVQEAGVGAIVYLRQDCLLYTSPSPRDRTRSRMPSSA